jgi:hypothetical protein
MGSPMRALEQASSNVNEASNGPRLRVGPIEVVADRALSSMSEMFAGLREGFSAPKDLPALRASAHIRLGFGEVPAPELDLAVTPFQYQPDGDLYRRENGRLKIEVSVRGTEVALKADVRRGQRTGEQFPKHLLMLSVSSAALCADALLVHACALVSPQGEGWLFLGASGQGKTTMTRRLPDWRRLGDDTVLVEALADDEAAWVSGTPFTGSEGLACRGERVRLTRIVVLEPGAPELSLTKVAHEDAFVALTRRIFCPLTDGPMAARASLLAERVATRTQGMRLASSLGHELTSLLEGS